jgi:hypothetical protein
MPVNDDEFQVGEEYIQDVAIRTASEASFVQEEVK